jgi:hypothetical protein
LLDNVRTQMLLRLLKPYTCARLAFLAEQLAIELPEVEALLVRCILDK